MFKCTNTWLYFMLIPFIIGVLIHFVIPLQFILTSNPKIEEVYNTYEIEIQQDTVRAVAFMNTEIFTNRIQMYENIRAIFIRILDTAGRYEIIDNTTITLNSAYQIANLNSSQLTQHNISFKKSMWYIPGVDSIENMNQQQLDLYNQLVQVQPFIQSVFNIELNLYDALVSVDLLVDYGNTTLFYQYPSQQKEQLKSLNATILTPKFIQTKRNYLQNNIQETVFTQGRNMSICEPIFDRDDLIIGINCLTLNLQKVFNEITQSLSLEAFARSQSQYNILTPVYDFTSNTNPELVFSFNDSNPDNIVFYDNQFYDLPTDISNKLFQSTKNYELFVYRYEITQTYYILPITILDYRNVPTNILYMMVINNFIQADLNFQNRQHNLLVALLVPSLIMLFFASIFTLCILKKLLSNMDNAINKLNESCALILKGDLHIQIPNYAQSQDLVSLFNQFRILNQLHKYSEPKYFDIPKPQRIIKYIKCYKLFGKLQYNISNVCQNIAQCYAALQEYHNSIKFMQMSVEEDLFQFMKKEGEIEEVFQKKINRKRKASKITKTKQINLIRKYFKLINYLYLIYEPGDTVVGQKISDNIVLLQKIAFPRVLKIEYMSALIIEIRYKFKSGEIKSMKSNLKNLAGFIDAYQLQNKKEANGSQIMFDIIKSSYRFLQGLRLKEQGQIIQAYSMFVRALQSNYYNPKLHTLVSAQIDAIMQKFRIKKSLKEDMIYVNQYHEREHRQYIFLIDVSYPQNIDTKVWKKSSKELAEAIFNKYIYPQDRTSILQFCRELKVASNLIEKKNQEKIIKKELLSSLKCVQKKVFSNPISYLKKAIGRVSHLQKEKYFIIYLKGLPVDGNEIRQIVDQTHNCQFIFIISHPQQIQNKQEGYYVILLQNNDMEDIDRILSQKVVVSPSNSIYLF